MLVPLLFLLGVVASSPARGDDGRVTAAAVAYPLFYLCTPVKDTADYYCNNSKRPADRTFQANLVTLCNVLPGNARASGFALGAFGEARDTVYGLALCRGDFTGAQCASCLAMGLNLSLSTICVHSKNASVYYDQCQFHFSDKDAILAVTGDSNFPGTTTYVWNMNNVSSGNVAAFDALVKRLVVAVADAASDAVGRYGTGQAGFPPEATNVYALAQCTPDLTPEQCRRCLGDLFGEMSRVLTGRVGGRFLGVRCNIRYKRELFFVPNSDTVRLTPLDGSSSTTRGKDPQIMVEGYEEIQEVAKLCTKLKGEDRPTMREVEMTLDNLLVQKRQISYNGTTKRNDGDGTMTHYMSIINQDTREASRQYTMEEEMLLSASYPR